MIHVLARNSTFRLQLPRRLRKTLIGYLFIAPWLLGFFIWVIGPMVASAAISLTEWNILEPARWVGLKNYELMFGLLKSPGEGASLFGLALYNTAYVTLLGVPLEIIAALAMAMFLNYKGAGVNFFRTVYYLPVITPAVASALVWLWLFNPEFGLANVVLHQLGLPTLTWFRDPDLAKALFVMLGIWGVGNRMVILLAGLQGVPDHLYDAAKVDGANALRQFWSITLPMISPTIFFVVCTNIIQSFQIFTGAYIITGGGPVNSTLFYVLYIYRNAFEYLKMGMGCALAWVLFLIILLVTLLQFWLAKRWVYYEVS